MNLLREQVFFVTMVVNPRLRPQNCSDVIRVLKRLTSSWVKVEYVTILQKWLPVDEGWQALINEASQQDGYVREKLFRLAESWDDSTRG